MARAGVAAPLGGIAACGGLGDFRHRDSGKSFDHDLLIVSREI